MKLNLSFSPCPNDTFMFEALIQKRVNIHGLDFKMHLGDIEELNQQALAGEADITKISFANYPAIANNYELMDSGSALGRNNGPILVSKLKIYPDEVNDLRIAIPGEKTTANLLFSLFYPEAKNKKPFLFSDIEEVVLSGEADAGLIIHETRFTYMEKGLRKISDVGELWEDKTNLPVPLGGIVIKRKLQKQLKLQVQSALRESIKFAFAHPEASLDFTKKHSQTLDETVIRKHIDLYVNQYSIELKNEGRKAITYLLQKGVEQGFFSSIEQEIFL